MRGSDEWRGDRDDGGDLWLRLGGIPRSPLEGDPQREEQVLTADHLFVTGFMGAGKSTVGRRVATLLDLPFVDLDHEIEATAGESIATLFSRDGERAFRRLEGAALRRLGGVARSVVATGGGLPGSSGNREWMRRHGVIVWLDVPLDLAVARVSGDRSRPLASDREALAELYEARLEGYRDCDLRIAVGPTASIGAVAGEVVDRLDRGASACS